MTIVDLNKLPKCSEIDLKRSPFVDAPLAAPKNNKNNSLEPLNLEGQNNKFLMAQYETNEVIHDKFNQLKQKEITQIKDWEKFKNIAKIVKITGIVLTVLGLVAALAVLGGPIFPAILGVLTIAVMLLLFIIIIAILVGDKNPVPPPSADISPPAGFFSTPMKWCFSTAPKYIADAIYGSNIAAITGIVTGAVTGVGLLLLGCGKLAERHYEKKIEDAQKSLKNEELKFMLEYRSNQISK